MCCIVIIIIIPKYVAITIINSNFAHDDDDGAYTANHRLEI